MKQSILTLALFFASSSAVAQTGSVVTATPESTVTAPFKLKAPMFGPMKLRVGVKSQGTSARVAEYEDAKGKRYKQKHEYSLGAVHTSGWGAYGQAVTSGTTYGDSKKDTLSGGDASLTLLHPDYYKGNDWTIGGRFRRYFPVSDRSVNRGQKQYAYYLQASRKLPARGTISNEATPRFFDQDYYKSGDTKYLFEDTTTLSRSVNDWFTFGVSQWSQVEWHEGTATGTSVDAGLFGKFSFFGGFSFEPRLWFPLAVRNTVNDAASVVTLRSARAEVTAQLSL